MLTPTEGDGDAVRLCGLVLWWCFRRAVTCWDYVSCGRPEHLWRGHGRFLRTHPRVSCPTVLPAGEERWEARSAVRATVNSSEKWYDIIVVAHRMAPFLPELGLKKFAQSRACHLLCSIIAGLIVYKAQLTVGLWLKHVDNYSDINFRRLL